MSLPSFLGIGAPKAGTTWLYENLRQHPQIWLPPVKEIHYFDRPKTPYLLDALHPHASRRYLFFRWFKPAMRNVCRRPAALAWYVRFFCLPRSDRWYASLFNPQQGQLTGDITPTYGVLPDADIANLSALLPHAKLIFIRRDPVERIWSHAAMYFSRYGQRGLANATRPEIMHFIHQPYVQKRSDYPALIRRWQRFFPAPQWHIGDYADLQRDPVAFFTEICIFLEIAPYTPSHVADPVHRNCYPPIPDWVEAELRPHFTRADGGMDG